jgi:Na+/proline symporter
MIVYFVVILVVGAAASRLVKGSGQQFVVAGRSLPFFIVGTTLLAQSLDANATLGNAAAVSAGGWWAGFQFPLGLALSLVVMGLFFAKRLHKLNLLTLGDFYYRRYNRTVEVLVGVLTAFSFAILVAGNIAGSAFILKAVFDWEYLQALFAIAVIVAAYVVLGGLWSVVAVDTAQIYFAVTGFVVAVAFFLITYGWSFFEAAIPAGHLDLSGLTSVDHGALLNWAGIIALAFGNAVALDFNARIYASRSGLTAQRACFYAAGFTLLVGIAASVLGLMSLTLVPEVADPRLSLPTLALEHAPFLIGMLILAGVVAAGISTADGGLAAVSAVIGRNFLQRNILKIWKGHYTADDRQRLDGRLLTITRLSAIPIMALAFFIAYVRPEPGILLVLAFDVVFAGCFVPLTLGLYWRKANTAGALAAIGSALRLILYFTIPAHLAGLDTLIPPVVSLVAMVAVSLATQQADPPKHVATTYVPTDEEVLSTQY